jgi:hypothetical protein
MSASAASKARPKGCRTIHPAREIREIAPSKKDSARTWENFADENETNRKNCDVAAECAVGGACPDRSESPDARDLHYRRPLSSAMVRDGFDEES